MMHDPGESDAAADDAVFRLVDEDGNTINDGRRGLLLYNGGTVCDDGFGSLEASVICEELGYSGAEDYDSDGGWEIQSNYQITLDDVSCNSEGEGYLSCSFSETHNCGHHEDIFLTCSSPTDEPEAVTEESATTVIAPTVLSSIFRLVDDNGNEVEGGRMGLLLYNGGTVCDDSFTENSADAICREMGYSAASNWDSGDDYESQSGYDIKLDDVSCSSGNWSSCTYSLRHNCGHHEDVFLECEAAADEVDIDSCFVQDRRTSGTVIEEVTYTGRENCVELCLSRDG